MKKEEKWIGPPPEMARRRNNYVPWGANPPDSVKEPEPVWRQPLIVYQLVEDWYEGMILVQHVNPCAVGCRNPDQPCVLIHYGTKKPEPTSETDAL